ncbi:hypothetical protein G7K_0809-t1 [Saitoella complicata NRRL Y-17804]|uniref:Uncharacterized protein n=1 Tax=Saitoella complicata (strain BCRC 22490 / CBS 7301 / JCM 7358 / NBRC 10748 / NRRL Y-17804) TaxID=698492 RepID=A0A0E9NAZ3_SAICN|nr:hypothetical protein G7K_0809-t1 [Saitoella complicata NRRL Y-17804]
MPELARMGAETEAFNVGGARVLEEEKAEGDGKRVEKSWENGSPPFEENEASNQSRATQVRPKSPHRLEVYCFSSTSPPRRNDCLILKLVVFTLSHFSFAKRTGFVNAFGERKEGEHTFLFSHSRSADILSPSTQSF